MNNGKVWFVTGASQGLGLTLVNKLLKAGYRVAATSRNAHKLKNAVNLIDSARFLPLVSDLRNPDGINESVRQTIKAFGRIDVVVNNAGYGMAGTLEETIESEVSKIVDINLIAAVNVIKNVLPIMREQRSGHIFNIGSVAGLAGASGWSVYSATKSALTALSEVLAIDIKEFGIKVTAVMPSGFCTGFLTEDPLLQVPSIIEGYGIVNKMQEKYLAANGSQSGDPEKAAQSLMEIAESLDAPLHLFLGKDAYERAKSKMVSMLNELEKWKDISIAADFTE